MAARLMDDLPEVSASRPCVPPTWARLQRELMAALEQAAREHAERYTLADGSLRWRRAWPGMDGSDDPYEGFWGLPLLYALGASEDLLSLARRQWEAITWQWTEYGQLHREFDASYDWMHHGESSNLFYLLGLADPTRLRERQRAVRFAGFYTGDDAEAPNYDRVRKLIRSPLNGSRGPHFTVTAEDWSTHREVLDHYPPPFEDIPGVEGPVCPWTDDRVFGEILERMNERMTRGDVPLNITATSLVAHAYLYTGDDRYREWVLQYLEAWAERARRNGGIIPDNVGPDGVIGQHMDGKWWGGYYGWRWPHGASQLLEAVAVGCCSAALVGGSTDHLGLIRSQLDALWALGREEGGEWVVPHKHLDRGWTAYAAPSPLLPVYCWSISREQQDLERVLRLSGSDRWAEPSRRTTKGNGAVNSGPWFAFVRGENPGYPEQILETNYAQMLDRLQAIRAETADLEHVDVHHWQDRSPVFLEGLVQLMLGAPLHLYHGGLLLTTFRYHDAVAGRPGLPPGVAALVERVEEETATLRLVNCGSREGREVVVQAGGFGEHRFAGVAVLGEDGGASPETEIDGRWLRVRLGPSAAIRLRLRLHRFVYRPSYETPWTSPDDWPPLLEGRKQRA